MRAGATVPGVDNDVKRYGRGVPGARPVRRWFGIKPEYVIAAAVLISVGLMVASSIWFNRDEFATASQSPETTIQCVSIKREHEAWERGYSDLHALPHSGVVTDHRIKQLKTAADAYAKATRGYDDQASKRLAVLVATYNLELATLNTEFVFGDGISAEQHTKTEQAWDAVQAGYRDFQKATCG